ncbi:MAG: helix-turn-helix domain-containing protein [Bacteroidetes bacterium]|nr:helix-turn-helix domain-containing protein [Bacteroidota bacterium]HET6242931.1 helix-turn-helix domain-containing protein [Bacteroidia bacterium]
MKTSQIKNREEYDEVMKRIEKSLQKITQLGGIDKLPSKAVKTLKELSLMAEEYEDSIPLMPIKKPTNIIEMIRYKMFEMNLKQKQLAKLLEVSETRLSELLSGKRKLTIELAKKLHAKLNIDAQFILEVA